MKYADRFSGGSDRVKETLRGILLARARSGKTIYYSEVGERVGRGAQGPWPELDAIADEDAAANRPDSRLLVIQRDSGYPSRFQKKPFNPNNGADLAAYTAAVAELFAFHRPPGR